MLGPRNVKQTVRAESGSHARRQRELDSRDLGASGRQEVACLVRSPSGAMGGRRKGNTQARLLAVGSV